MRLVPFCVLAFSVGTASAQVKNWPTETPPRPLAAHDIKFPPYEFQTLPNGLQVVAVLQHEQPVVSMRLLVRAGSAADPKDKLGTARLAASLLDQGILAANGSPASSAEQLADAIDFIGGEMGAGAATDLTHVNMVVMKDSFEFGMRMLSDIARYPSFDKREIERQRQQMLSGLQVSAQDPEYVANAVFDRLVYGFHPYGMPDSGTPETLAGLTRDDLVAFHAKYFHPNNAILAVVGDVTADEAFTMAKKVFGDWQKHDLPADTYIDPPDPTRRLIVVNKPDAVQTEVRVGHIGIPRSHPDYLAVSLAIRILGGEGSNRLHQVLRTERGLTYGAQANMDSLKVSGDFEAQTNTRSEATGEVLRLIVDEFWRLQRERVGERELADAKAYMTGSFPLTIETPDAIALQVVNNIFYGLPLEQLQNLRERVNAVSVDDIQRVARAYLRPDRLSVVLVGNASAFAAQLRGVGFATYETVELSELDLMSASLKRPGTRTGANRVGAAVPAPDGGMQWRTGARAAVSRLGYSSSPAPIRQTDELQKARSLVGRVIDAKGGLDTLRAVKSIVVKQTLTNPAAPDDKGFQTTTYIEYPDRFRTETMSAQGAVNVQVFDGSQLWARDAQGVRDLPATMTREARNTLRRDPIAVLLAATDGRMTPRLLPDVKDPDGHAQHALELSAPDFNPVVLFIDVDSAQLKRMTFVAETPGRPAVEDEYSDYRAVSGVQIAFAASRRSGQQAIARTITDIRINSPIDPALFKRPS
ncbi:MAG TPA: pitrilysin family protein [Vicinamibacterales bacterium]